MITGGFVAFTAATAAAQQLRGPDFWQLDLMVSKDFPFAAQGIQLRAEMFNITNRLNYENPAASLPNGSPGAAFTDAQTGTFGYMLGHSIEQSAWALRDRPSCRCGTSFGSRSVAI